MALILGIDEAGRGPAIGPLVICGVTIDARDEKKLREIGTRDSKELTPRARELLYGEILKIIKQHKLIVIPPQEIDDAVLSDSDNLNWLEARKSAQIINELKAATAYLDCPSNNIGKYSGYIAKHITKKIKLVAEHKADAKYPVVSAASILAKVTRDREIEKIKEDIGVDFFARNFRKYPSIFRKSWASWRAVNTSSGQKKLGEF